MRVIPVSRAQRRVVGELARDGASNEQIAARLNVTAHTVRSHLKPVMARAGCPTRTALVVALLRGELRLRTVDSVAREEAA